MRAGTGTLIAIVIIVVLVIMYGGF